MQEEKMNFTSLTVLNEPIAPQGSKLLLIKGCLGSSRADVASIFEEYACPNIVTRRAPFRVPLLMTTKFQRAPPACLGFQDCHLRDLLLLLCALSFALGSVQILPSPRLGFDLRFFLLLQASCYSALPRLTRLGLHLHYGLFGLVRPT